MKYYILILIFFYSKLFANSFSDICEEIGWKKSTIGFDVCIDLNYSKDFEISKKKIENALAKSYSNFSICTGNELLENCIGTINYSNGNVYVGIQKPVPFDDNLMHGFGYLFWSDGTVWAGNWEDDVHLKGKKYKENEYKGAIPKAKSRYTSLSRSLPKNKNKNTNIVAELLTKNNDISNKAFYEEKRRREKVERELAELKALNKKEKQLINTDTVPPQIAITSSGVKDKQGIIVGVVLDNIKVAELTINEEEVNFDNEGNFNYSTFIPKKGKKISIKATDTKGLSSEKIVALQRKKISTDIKLNFSELNPLKLKGKKNENALALIIGVNNYLYAPEAKYADRDASYFADFATNTIGIKKENIKTLSNAKAINTEIKIALKSWLKVSSTPNQSDIYIFFAGHGLASIDGKELYLLPYDGEPRLLEDTALLRSEIFDTVKSTNPKSVTVFLDACYSGQTRDKNMILADARPIAIVPIESDVPENFTVFSASSRSEISGSLPEADHGLFSYFLMKGLEGDADANNDRKITNGELLSYVRSNVTRQAARLGREQTPQLQGDENRVLVEFN